MTANARILVATDVVADAQLFGHLQRDEEFQHVGVSTEP